MAGRIRTVTIREDPLKRLGALVKAAREAIRDENARSLSKIDASLQMPISRQILDNVEAGTPLSSSTTKKPRSATDRIYVVIEEFFGWPQGSILRYLHERGPEPGPVLALVRDEVAALDDEGESRRVGKVVAQWYRSAPLDRRDHAFDLLIDFMERHPHGGADS